MQPREHLHSRNVNIQTIVIGSLELRGRRVEGDHTTRPDCWWDVNAVPHGAFAFKFSLILPCLSVLR